MSMVCPQCRGHFDQYLQCPLCGVRLTYEGANGTGVPGAQDGRWQHTPWGRLVVGLLVAQGLAYGLRMLCTAGILVSGEESVQGVWPTLFGLIVIQGLQGVSLLVAGALAGAGQPRGALLGSILGLVNGLIAVAIQFANREQITEVMLYGQPVLHLAFGTVGGLIGTLIWKPLPTLTLASAPGAKQGTTARAVPTVSPFAGPVAWVRVTMGSLVVLAGVLWPKVVLEFVVDASSGKMNLSSHLQAELVTWEVSALAVALGSCLAGSGTPNGLKQGLCVFLLSSALFVAINVGGRKLQLEPMLFTVFLIGGVSLAGGWFGSRLFPPVVTQPRRSALQRLES